MEKPGLGYAVSAIRSETVLHRPAVAAMEQGARPKPPPLRRSWLGKLEDVPGRDAGRRLNLAGDLDGREREFDAIGIERRGSSKRADRQTRRPRIALRPGWTELSLRPPGQ